VRTRIPAVWRRSLLAVAFLVAASFAGFEANSLRATLAAAPSPPGVGHTAVGAQGHPSAVPTAAGRSDSTGSSGGGSSASSAPQVLSLPSTVTHLPGSDTTYISEPSLTLDRAGNVYVTGPTGLNPGGNFVTSPLWKSTDAGASFTGPVTTTNAGPEDASLGGGDSDIVIDSNNNVFITSLWLGNTSTSVSTDGGATWTGIPYAHPQPVDDRPWYAYDPVANALYMTWDGIDGLHVGKALLKGAVQGTAAEPIVSLFFAQDVIAVPEDATGTASAQDESIRNCACPPGGITVDPSGDVFVVYGRQSGPGIGGGVGVAESTNGGLTWTPTSVPNSGVPVAGPQSVDRNFPQIHSDGAGNVYTVWAQPTSDSDASEQVDYSYLLKGTTTWSDPVRVSVTRDAVFPAFAVVAPGLLDVAYYGTDAYAGDSEKAPKGTSWGVYLTQLTAFGVAHATTNVALADFHDGTICTSGLNCSTTGVDRSLGDFFSIAIDNAGNADIITDDQRQGHRGVSLIHQTAPLLTAPTAVPPAVASAAAVGRAVQPFAPSLPGPVGSASTAVATAEPVAAASAAATPGPLGAGLSLNVPASAARVTAALPPDASGLAGNRLPWGTALALFAALLTMALLTRGLRRGRS
jgi:hypothetical protein